VSASLPDNLSEPSDGPAMGRTTHAGGCRGIHPSSPARLRWTDEHSPPHPQRRTHHPAARLRRLQSRSRADRAHRQRRPRGRLPPHRHRGHLRQRGRRRTCHRRQRHRAGRAVHHDEALERPSGLATSRSPRSTRACEAGPGRRRPVPRALARAGQRQLRERVGEDGADPRGGKARSIGVSNHLPRTCPRSSPQPASRRPSIRSNCTRPTSSRTSPRSRRSTAS
jgi:hypothetical protein